MSDSVFVEFTPVDRKFNKRFVEELVRSITGKGGVRRKIITELYEKKGGHIDLVVQELGRQFRLELGVNLLATEAQIKLVLSLGDWYFSERNVGSTENIAKLCDRLTGICVAAYDYLEPFHGYGDWGVAIDYVRRKEKDDARNVYWLNFYGPSLADGIGRHKLLELPRRFESCEVTELEDGGIFVRSGRTPADTGEIGAMKEYLFGK